MAKEKVINETVPLIDIKEAAKTENQKLAESFGLTLDDFCDDQSDLEDLKEIIEGGE
jgi:hypothetical protein